MKKEISTLKPKNKIEIHDSYWKNLKLGFYIDQVIKYNQKDTNQFLLNQINNLSKINKIFFYPSSFDPHKS